MSGSRVEKLWVGLINTIELIIGFEGLSKQFRRLINIGRIRGIDWEWIKINSRIWTNQNHRHWWINLRSKPFQSQWMWGSWIQQIEKQT
jgi:hypothetical protein